MRARYNEESRISAQLVGQYFARVGCITGPIIGKVRHNNNNNNKLSPLPTLLTHTHRR